MSIAKYKPFLYTVAVVVTIVAFVSESVVFLKETNEQFTINIIPIKGKLEKDLNFFHENNFYLNFSHFSQIRTWEW